MVISIVVPLFNAEKYLPRLFSLFENIRETTEVLFVDDGSKDLTKLKCEEFCAKKPTQYRVFSQVNRGVSSARNVGIEYAIGKWILFLDADDFFDFNWESIVYKYIDSQADLLVFGNNSSTILCNSKACVLSCLGDYSKIKNKTLNWVFSKMYKRNLIQSIRFDEQLINGEDTIFNIECFLKAKRIDEVNVSYYSFIKNLNSSTNKFDDKIFETELQFHRRLKEIGISQYGEFEMVYALSLLNGIYSICYRLALSKQWKTRIPRLLNLSSLEEYRYALKKMTKYQKKI